MSKIKPTKSPGCPLLPHPSGRRAKKFKDDKCKFRYYGPWDDLPAGLAKYEAKISGVPVESNSLAEKK
jgi:hypothetical protein